MPTLKSLFVLPLFEILTFIHHAFFFILVFCNTTWTYYLSWGFPGGSVGKESPARKKMWVQSPGQEDLLEKGMATHPRILAWRITWTEELGRLQAHRVTKSRTWLKWLSIHCLSWWQVFGDSSNLVPKASVSFFPLWPQPCLTISQECSRYWTLPVVIEKLS